MPSAATIAKTTGCTSLAAVMLCLATGATAQQRPYVAFGIFLGKIEEGARIFTPARMLPPEHPESLQHDFPTVLRFHQAEYDLMVMLGEKAGFGLQATLQRYPTRPVGRWWLHEFEPPPVDDLREAPTKTFDAGRSPVAGLRAAAFKDRVPIAFIVDTRHLTLEQRGMRRPTTSGLDIDRERFLRGLAKAGKMVPAEGAWFAVFQPGD